MCVVCCVFVCVRALEFFFFWCVFHFILSCSRCKAEQSIHTSCIATERSERFVRWPQKKQQQNTYQYGKRAQIVVCAIRFPSQCSLNMWLYVDVDFIFIYIYIHNISHGFCCYTFYILFLACLRFILPIWLCSKNVQMLTYTESPIDMMADLLLYLLKHICIAHTIADIFVNHYYSLFDLHHTLFTW